MGPASKSRDHSHDRTASRGEATECEATPSSCFIMRGEKHVLVSALDITWPVAFRPLEKICQDMPHGPALDLLGSTADLIHVGCPFLVGMWANTAEPTSQIHLEECKQHRAPWCALCPDKLCTRVSSKHKDAPNPNFRCLLHQYQLLFQCQLSCKLRFWSDEEPLRNLFSLMVREIGRRLNFLDKSLRGGATNLGA